MNFMHGIVGQSRIVPVLVLIIVCCSLLYIPVNILGKGYLPEDDSLSHAAKVVSGKDWNDILILREEITMDSHTGWHFILNVVHTVTGWGCRPLVMFEVLLLFALFSIGPVFFVRRPEAWLAALLIIFITDPVVIHRVLAGRPFVFSTACLLIVCFLWPKLREKKINLRATVCIICALSLSAWVHGAWHLFLFPLGCFFLAREWRVGFVFLGCIVAQVFIAALLTGQPLEFIYHTVNRTYLALDGFPLQRMMVIELRGRRPSFFIVVAVAGLLFLRQIRGDWQRKVVDNPLFILSAVGFVLGPVVSRFWIDWGAPALCCWIALELRDLFESKIHSHSWQRIILTMGLAITLTLFVTADLDSRWTKPMTRVYLSKKNPNQAPWLPEPGGIIYNSDMRIFFRTFFSNPHENWRYMLGIEPSMMPKDLLAVFSDYRFRGDNPITMSPLVKRMTPADRMIIWYVHHTKPNVEGLEWYHAAAGIWLGRLPRGPDGKMGKREGTPSAPGS